MNSLPNNLQIVKINRSSKKKDLTSRTKKDYITITEEKRKYKKDIEEMKNILEFYFKDKLIVKELMELANYFVEKYSLKLDRLSKRNKDCLIIWFIKNISTVINDYYSNKGEDFKLYLEQKKNSTQEVPSNFSPSAEDVFFSPYDNNDMSLFND